MDLFADAKLVFEKSTPGPSFMVREDHALYEIRPAKKKLE
jgi:hypothetical protein